MRAIRVSPFATVIVVVGLIVTGTILSLPYVSAEVGPSAGQQVHADPPARPVFGPPGPQSNDTVPGIATPTLIPTPTLVQVAPQPTLSIPPTTGLPVQPLTCGLLTNFDQFGTWKRGDEPYGTFASTAEQAYSSPYSGKLTYSFPTAGNDYVVFKRTIPMGGTGNAVTAWVYGDGSGHYLNCWVRDATGEVWSFPFGRIQHTGWQLMSAPLDVTGAWPTDHVSGPANGVLEYPVSFFGLVLDDAPDTYAGTGAIYIDDISCSDVVLPISPPTQGGSSQVPSGPLQTPSWPSPGQSSAGCTVTLLDPPDGSQYSGETERVTLHWAFNRTLAPNEYFFVNVQFPHGGQTWYDGTWRDPGQQLPDGTRDTSWTLRDYLCGPGFSDSGWYNWSVTVMQQLGSEKSLNDPVVCTSNSRSLNWSGCVPQPADDGYDLYVRRMDFTGGSPSVGDTVGVFIMIASDIHPDGEPYFPASHFRWRIDGDSPWHEESCSENSTYATCVKDFTVTYSSPGEHNFKVEADSQDEVNETDEGNNTKKWPINVSP